MASRKKDSRGAITVEATIALTAFLFMFMMLYSIITMCRAQAIIGAALDNTAKEISQYTYLYSLTGIQDSLDGVFENNETVKTVDDFTGQINTALNAMQQLNVDGEEILHTEIDSTADISNAWLTLTGDLDDVSDATSAVMDGIEEMSKDPKNLLLGLCKMAASDGISLAKSKLLAPPICRGLIQKHLVNTSDGSVEGYLHSLRVVPKEAAGGKSYLKGLDFGNSVLFATKDYEIILRVEYELKVIPYLPLDLKVKICQTAVTRGWANGDGRTLSKDGSVTVVKPNVKEEGQTPSGSTATAIPTTIPTQTTATSTTIPSTTAPSYTPATLPSIGPSTSPGVGLPVSPGETVKPSGPGDVDLVLKQQMAEKYGTYVIEQISSAYDFTGWQVDDWEYYIVLALKDGSGFELATDKRGYDQFLTRTEGMFSDNLESYLVFKELMEGNFTKYVSYFDFSSEPGKGYLWSDSNDPTLGRAAAESYIAANGGTIMEMTQGGKVLDGWSWLQEKFPDWHGKQKWLWIAASEKYASGLSGEVIYFNSTYEGDIYLNYELRMLKELYEDNVVTGLVYANEEYYEKHYEKEGKTPLD